MIHRLGKEINNTDSVYYWAYKVVKHVLLLSLTWLALLCLCCSPADLVAKRAVCVLLQNNIPVFSPALTDGSLGDMIYFHSYKNPGLILDIVEGLKRH